MARVNVYSISFMFGLFFTLISLSVPVDAGQYQHPNLRIEWEVRFESDRILLTGMLVHSLYDEIQNVEMICRALQQDHSEMGRERFVFYPYRMRNGYRAPFGMFFSMRDNTKPSVIECSIFFERASNSSGGEFDYHTFTAIIP